MKNIFAQLEKLKVIPVVKIEDSKNAIPLAKALIEGGLPTIEVTLRTDTAIDSIKKISSEAEILLGAGTVLTIKQVKEAIDAGAQFIVTPGLNPKLVKYCIDNNITIIPGVSTPTEIEATLEFGLKVVKFFPAEAFGGVNTLKAISSPYKIVRFIPTGGINPKNLMDYLALKAVIACGGTWIAKEELINKGNFKEITKLTREAIALIK
jgi:2-dehydro-3-deoxyphosphogluconate aldolase/(4S)-4-hydroxy-2-oxoglutarate aldolase